MRFFPYHELGSLPNIIVDGSGNSHSKLTLSHWPQSGTPWELKADTSTEIVFRYLDRPNFHVRVDFASNNHFDEDGLAGLYALLNPEAAQKKRELLIDVATAGDFGTYQDPRAARIVFVLSALSNAETSPLPPRVFQVSYKETTAMLYQELLARFPEILANLDSFREYWEKEEEELHETETAIRSGRIKIEEIPAVDLSVVTLPENDYHMMALHNAIKGFRVLVLAGRKYEFKYRYESWVQFLSRRPLPRVDLNPLAERLSHKDNGLWSFDGVDDIIPRLQREDEDESRLSPEVMKQEVIDFLSKSPSAWDPFDPAQ